MIPTVINSIVHHAASKANEGFTYVASEEESTGTVMFASIIAFIIVLLIVAFVGMYLWNECLAGSKGLLTFARPATSAWQIVGLYVFVALFVGV